MAKVYINIHSGPELKNKATLGLLVAVNAQKKGHDEGEILELSNISNRIWCWLYNEDSIKEKQ